MHNIFLIIQREYLTRVRKKSFLIMSIVGPLLIAGLWVVPIWLSTRETDQKTIEILDDSGYFEEKFTETSSLKFKYIQADLVAAKTEILSSENYGLLYIPRINLDEPEGITFFSGKNPSIEVIQDLEWAMKSVVEDIKLERSSIDQATLDSLRADIDIDMINMTDSGEKAGSAGVATIIGYISALMIYFFIFVYGIQILRGVIEEKSSRIVEVIVSSVKPFHLMMGKILGVGAVGLTQYIIWLVLSIMITAGISSYFNIDRTDSMQVQTEQSGVIEEEQSNEFVAEMLNSLESIDFSLLAVAFLLYFLGAYLLYGSLFAAIGSAVDNDSDAQQFQLPVTIPLIFSLIVLTAILREPDGSLAFWLSMIPLFSPVIMMMRIPFGVPYWEIGLSLTLLIAGFIFTTWLASRIYRIGILMHGAKVNYRILGKWLFMKN
ncbi:MAG: ABC transporter permease [Cyclobacteriaceae bacterium]|jgi:ABC-2 type transport system permease protein